ncbi:MAG: DNA repair exonuclease [Syntrophomonadaceae bacterium]|nr:DNA repair exonuclease [Syntrophomonadaceae bacterium]
MLKILHLADLHLGWEPGFLGSRTPEWREKRDQVFSAVVEYAVQSENNINLVLLVGDLFDNHTPHLELGNEVIRQLQRLVKRGIHVITVPGNHDEITYPDSIYRQRARDWPGILVQNPHPAHIVTLEINGVPCHIYALAYIGGLTPTRLERQEFPHNGEPGWHIAAFHGSLDWDAGDRSLPLSGEALGKAGYDYIALGHIHKPGQYPLARGVAVYPGNLVGKGWHDPGCGQLTVVTLHQSQMQIENVPFPYSANCSFEVIEMDVGSYFTLEELLNALAARVSREAMVSIRLVGTANFLIDAEVIRESLAYSASAFYLEVLDFSEVYPAELLDTWARENTLRGYYIRQMQERLTAVKDEKEQRLVRRALIQGLKALGSEF